MVDSSYYYNGGLAEIVARPSPLTFSFVRHWFTGSTSLGLAMELLGLPYVKRNEPVVALVNGQLMVNLIEEEKTLYQNTLFSYITQQQFADVPGLHLNWQKIIRPASWLGTLKLLQKQSIWIAKPEAVVTLAEKLESLIPEPDQTTTLKQVDRVLTEQVWTYVIAIGTLAEFFATFVRRECKDEKIMHFLSQQIAREDWFFLSVKDQFQVKSGQMTIANYLLIYGMRADQDYELTCPRWFEIPQEIEKRIDQSMPAPRVDIEKPQVLEKMDKFITALIRLQIFRTQSRRKALIFINSLRQSILKQAGQTNIKYKLREQLLNLHDDTTPYVFNIKLNQENTFPKNGEGTGVSKGIALGRVKQIRSVTAIIPAGVICIFPQASPEFSILFPRCKGIIFLQGGPTSHGAIVAREYGVPALVDVRAKNIPDGKLIEIDGVSGKWNISPGVKPVHLSGGR